MSEQIQYILARHADGTEERESAYHRLRVVGKAQLQPIVSPLQLDWEAHFPEAAAAVQAAHIGLPHAESPQPEPVQGVLGEASPVSP